MLILTYLQNWMYENPSLRWQDVVSRSTLQANEQLSYGKFADTASTDDPDLDKVRSHGAKIIHYHGTADPLILAFGSYNYVGRVFDRYGVAGTQQFMRSFFYPGVGHCTGGNGPQPDVKGMLQALDAWVEKGSAPDVLIAQGGPTGGATRTRKVCKYPDVAVYKGSGSTDDEASYACQTNDKVPDDLAAAAKTYRDQP